MITKAQLQEIVSKTDALEELVRKVTAPATSATKRIPFFSSQAFPIMRGDFGVKESTFLNGGEDIYMCGLTYNVCTNPAGSNIADYMQADSDVMFDNTQGEFDFQWNYRLMSSQSLFCSPANSSFLLSRKTLGNYERGEPLTFEKPLLIKGGDSVVFMLKAIFFDTVDTTALTRFITNLVFFGYRDGTTAENDFDALEGD